MTAAAMIATHAESRMERVGASARDLSDLEAVERARHGDHEAFRVLVERHQGRVQALALRILRDREAARDATQDAFLKAYAALDRFEGRAKFGTWMYRLAYNHCLDLKRKDRSSQQAPWEDELGAVGETPTHAAPPPSPGVAAERRELREQLAEAVAGLGDEARETLLLREIEGLSYGQIAELLDIPEGTVMSRLHHARRRLREALGTLGVDPESGRAGR
jgi:RNA polymerase sigma-70 factor (ECF subfamily)